MKITSKESDCRWGRPNGFLPGIVLLHKSGNLYLLLKNDMAVDLTNMTSLPRSMMDPEPRWMEVDSELVWSKP